MVTTPPVQIQVNAADVQGTVSRMLLGEGLIMGFTYMWDWKHNRTWPALLAMIKDLNTDILGHLGGPGVTVHDYHWKNVIGPVEKRTDPTPRFHDFDPMNGLWGTHEYGLMLEEYRKATNRNIVGSIQVNIMTGTAADAADWVEYMNGSPTSRWGSVRAANGHREPFGIEYWEMGNQPHYTFADVGRLTGVEYARRVREFTTAMKARDPSIKVTAYLPFFDFDGSIPAAMRLGSYNPNIPASPEPGAPTWAQHLLQEAGDLVDALDFHWYGSVHSKYHGYEYVMTSAYKGLLPSIEHARETVRRYAPSDEARERLSKFVCPEYGAMSNDAPGDSTATAIYGAVANSRLLHLLASRHDILYAQRFGLFAPYPEPNLIREVRTPYAAIIGAADGSAFTGTAAYQMKRLWAQAHGPKRVAVQTRDVNGVPVLDVTAMRSDDGRGLNVVLTNTGMSALQVSLVVSGFAAAPQARRLLLSGDLYDNNLDLNNQKVKLREDRVDTLVPVLPPHSVTALLIKGQ